MRGMITRRDLLKMLGVSAAGLFRRAMWPERWIITHG